MAMLGEHPALYQDSCRGSEHDCRGWRKLEAVPEGERPSPIGSRPENAVEYESFSIQPLPILYIETVLKAPSTLSERARKVVFLA
jgi:hypothetical protein